MLRTAFIMTLLFLLSTLRLGTRSRGVCRLVALCRLLVDAVVFCLLLRPAFAVFFLLPPLVGGYGLLSAFVWWVNAPFKGVRVGVPLSPLLVVSSPSPFYLICKATDACRRPLPTVKEGGCLPDGRERPPSKPHRGETVPLSPYF